MRRFAWRGQRPKLPVILFILLVSGSGQAQPPQGNAQAQPPQGTAQVRRDPTGKTGISPFWEAVKQGDTAFVAQDYEGAIAAYTSALGQEPNNPLGHLRIGEAHRAKGDFARAQEAFDAALRLVGTDARLRAKTLFLLADLRERQQQLAEAKAGWSTYAATLKQQPTPGGYPKSATERETRIDAWLEIQQQYAAVKERIATRLAEAEAMQRKGAK